MGVNDDHDLEDQLDTLSLTDFPLTVDDHGDSTFQHHHHNTPSEEEFFEFFNGGLGHHSEEKHRMSHAEDIIFAGKLIPINDQQPSKKTRDQGKQIERKRSESMRELKSTTNTNNTNNPTANRLVRNSHSLDYKKLNRHSRYNNYEPTAEIVHRNSLGNNNKSSFSSSSRWSDLMFGPVIKVPTEMDLRDIRNRQIIQNTSKSLFPTVVGGGGGGGGGGDRFSISRNIGYHRKTSSWGVLGILSCKSSGSVAVTMP